MRVFARARKWQRERERGPERQKAGPHPSQVRFQYHRGFGSAKTEFVHHARGGARAREAEGAAPPPMLSSRARGSEGQRGRRRNHDSTLILLHIMRVLSARARARQKARRGRARDGRAGRAMDEGEGEREEERDI